MFLSVLRCNNVNWARRKACNVCKAQRFGSCKARTGYGGGYMDRQDVEYISRKRDDEFDEFGRKKKGIKRSSDVIESEYCDGEEEFHRKAHKYEEEEDESGDDDLGKYDFGSDDEFESLKMSLAKKVAEANNASRASSPDHVSAVPAPVVKVKIRFARVMSRIPSGRLGTNTHAPLEVVLTVVGITRRNAFEFATIMTVTIEADVIMILTSGTVATAIGVILISGRFQV
ncbi:hypothetical protein QR680_000911 [Steinernema hermaphroditum]|uniref:Uncharacterized protein n=1 Tax=Steinernema hermaphroditum TaxID=289476 RepID=A0AA39LF05_9BILA|nr:hypothetical protein QR680_000911 [Steinernema hermaphroditum]